jgi:heptosyltransferase-3
MKDERIDELNDPSSFISPPLSFLIVRTDRLGDMILTLPMARAIKKELPNARVTFLLSEYTRPIVERAPDVDRIVAAGTRFLDLVRQFKGAKSDVAFFPNPKFRFALAAFLARIPKRVSTAYRWYSFLFTHRIRGHRRTADRHEAEYNLRMLREVGVNADENTLAAITLQKEEKGSVESWLNQSPVDSKDFAVLHTTSGGSSKEWPLAYFAELARKLKEGLGLEVIVTGNARQANFADSTFNGRTLPELGALLERASLVVSNSTGPGHLAAALGVPTVGLFPLPKALSKERWGFRGIKAKNLSPEPIPGCPDCKECSCMERLEIASVLKEVEELLEAQR